MGRACSMHGSKKESVVFFFFAKKKSLQEGDQWEDQYIVRRIILKWILREIG
jgi:hypothetical protein